MKWVVSFCFFCFGFFLCAFPLVAELSHASRHRAILLSFVGLPGFAEALKLRRHVEVP